MPRLVLLLLAVWASAFAFAQPASPSPIQIGDVIAVQVAELKDFSGEYPVLTDGTITGPGFGRVTAAGKTIEELKIEIVARLKRRLLDPIVDVFYRSQKLALVYVLNTASGTQGSRGGEAGTTGGAVPYTTGLDLRKLISSVTINEDADRLRLKVWRSGREVKTMMVSELIEPQSEGGTFLLEPDDVVTISPEPVVRVWIDGEVKNAGQQRMLARQATIQTAVASAGGLTEAATLTNVVVMRRGETLRIDASPIRRGEKVSPFQLEDGDLIYVRTNELAAVAVGEVLRPGRMRLEDGKQYRASDVLAMAGGLTANGSLLRVHMARFGPDGKVNVTKFDLDKFLKDGDLANNPIIRPDDVLLFGTPKGLTVNSLLALGNVVSTLILFDSWVKNR